MAGISYIKRITGSANSLVQVNADDTTATATAADYITDQADNIISVNNGEFDWQSNDLIILSASDGLSICSIDSDFTTLTALVSQISADNLVYNNIANQMATGGSVKLDKGTGTVSAGAVTINKQAGVITTTSLTTAAGATTAITFTNSFIATSSVVLVTLMGGTNTTIGVEIEATAGSGTSTITISNNNAAAALNGTLLIGFVVL